MNKSDSTKNKLIETVIELLKECNDISEITSRKITEKANINLSTINYHFGSKDELVKIAVGKLIGEIADDYFEEAYKATNPRDKLGKFLISICDIIVDYKKYTKEMIPYILLQSEFTQALQILPLVKECINEGSYSKAPEIISYELISFMQLAFYRSDEFKLFCGIDIMNKDERDKLINMQLNLLVR